MREKRQPGCLVDDAFASTATVKLAGHLQRGEQTARLGDAVLLLAHGVVLFPETLARLDAQHDFAWISALRQAPAIEVPYAGEMVERVEYDTVYHEHLSYFSIAALLRLCESVGLSAARIDRLPVHGGSLRLYLSRKTGGHAPDVCALEAEERRAGLADVPRYRQFAAEVRESRDALVGLLEVEWAPGFPTLGRRNAPDTELRVRDMVGACNAKVADGRESVPAAVYRHCPGHEWAIAT